jgi:carbamate kinase
MDNEFRMRGIKKSAVTVVTQVIVAADDPAFQNPSKPIGSFCDKERAEAFQKANPHWVMMNDAGRGYRRVVPSPYPMEILEKEVINRLVREGYCVVAGGGGGIPVLRQPDGMLRGVDAVIDKDLASSLLATEIGADMLVISTSVPRVCLNYGNPDEKPLDRVTVAELKRHIAENQFAPGSMLPKIQAVMKFIEKGGKKAVVTNPESLVEAVAGKTGTHILI